MNDWVEGDLLKVTRTHIVDKGSMDKAWPDVFPEEEEEKDRPWPVTEVTAGTVVLAMDPCPSAGDTAFIRIVHKDGVWVANSNYVQRVWPDYTETTTCTTAKQETFSS